VAAATIETTELVEWTQFKHREPSNYNIRMGTRGPVVSPSWCNDHREQTIRIMERPEIYLN